MCQEERPDWQCVMAYVTAIYKHFEVWTKMKTMKDWREEQNFWAVNQPEEDEEDEKKEETL